jgi:hypothetical protein
MRRRRRAALYCTQAFSTVGRSATPDRLRQVSEDSPNEYLKNLHLTDSEYFFD